VHDRSTETQLAMHRQRMKLLLQSQIISTSPISPPLLSRPKKHL
jgi:hypothetical protein